MLDKFEKPEPSELAILVDKLVTLDMILPAKELLIALAALLAFELTVLKAELNLLAIALAALETLFAALIKAFLIGAGILLDAALTPLCIAVKAVLNPFFMG